MYALGIIYKFVLLVAANVQTQVQNMDVADVVHTFVTKAAAAVAPG